MSAERYLRNAAASAGLHCVALGKYERSVIAAKNAPICAADAASDVGNSPVADFRSISRIAPVAENLMRLHLTTRLMWTRANACLCLKHISIRSGYTGVYEKESKSAILQYPSEDHFNHIYSAACRQGRLILLYGFYLVFLQ